MTKNWVFPLAIFVILSSFFTAFFLDLDRRRSRQIEEDRRSSEEMAAAQELAAEQNRIWKQGKLFEARRRNQLAGDIVAVVEERYLDSEFVGSGKLDGKCGGSFVGFSSEIHGEQASAESTCCVLVLRTEAGNRLAVYVESRGEVRALAAYALARPGTKVSFRAGNLVQADEWPATTYGTFFDKDTFVGVKGADQLKFIETID